MKGLPKCINVINEIPSKHWKIMYVRYTFASQGVQIRATIFSQGREFLFEIFELIEFKLSDGFCGGFKGLCFNSWKFQSINSFRINEWWLYYFRHFVYLFIQFFNTINQEKKVLTFREAWYGKQVLVNRVYELHIIVNTFSRSLMSHLQMLVSYFDSLDSRGI